MKVERLTLRTHQSRIEEGQGIAANLHPITAALEAGNDVGRIHGLHLLTADARPYTDQTVGRVRPEHAIVWNAAWKNVSHRDLESNREDVEAGEHVSGRSLGATCAGDTAQVARVQVDRIEDSLLVELIGIVELAGDDPRAIRQTPNISIDECLIVETDGASCGIAGVITLEGGKTVDGAIGLRSVVVR